MMCYSIEPKQKIFKKNDEYLVFAENIGRSKSKN